MLQAAGSLSLVWLGACGSMKQAPSSAPAPVPAPAPTPPLRRECRAAWVATVANIDWPSRPGLSAPEMQAEMDRLLDCASTLKLNLLIVQVRDAADALYPSALEPWAEVLSGAQGLAPSGEGYDPLARWIEGAHRRGIALHAWINPFRARHSSARSPAADSHVSVVHPEWVRAYGDQLWLDPSEPDAMAHTLAVCRDLLTRYALDGLHIDDYFYPYPAQDASGQALEFPDQRNWNAYQSAGGSLSRADWRRGHVNRFVAALYALVRECRPCTLFGISPFGLPRPDLRPPGIKGFSQYDALYADVELWLQQGWLDYLAPQLYWPRAQTPQAFETLLRTWQALNQEGRAIWPGLFSSQLKGPAPGWSADEIVAQIELVRAVDTSTAAATGSGHVHFSMSALARNWDGLADRLRAGPYAQSAALPAMPWLGESPCSAAPAPETGA